QIFRCPRSVGERPYGRGADASHARHKRVIQKRREIAELDTIDYLNVLVLVVEVLIWLRESGGRVSKYRKRNVIACSKVPVAPSNEPASHASRAIFGDRFGEPAKFARRAVVLTTYSLQIEYLCGRCSGRYSFRKEPDLVRVFSAILRGAIAD